MTAAWLNASGLRDIYLPAFRFHSWGSEPGSWELFRFAKLEIGDSTGKVIPVDYRESVTAVLKSGWQELTGDDWKLKYDHKSCSLAVQSAGVRLAECPCQISHRYLRRHCCEFDIGTASVYATLPRCASFVNWGCHRFAHVRPHGEHTWCLRMVADNFDDLPRDMAKYRRFRPPPSRAAERWSNTTALGCILIACLALGIEDAVSS